MWEASSVSIATFYIASLGNLPCVPMICFSVLETNASPFFVCVADKIEEAQKELKDPKASAQKGNISYQWVSQVAQRS